MGHLQILRLCAFYSITILSLVTLILSARLFLLHSAFASTTISLIAAVINFITFPLILSLDHFQDGTHGCPIIVEIICCIVSGIVWLVTAGMAATSISDSERSGLCSTEQCHQARAVEVLSIISSVTLLMYASILLLKSMSLCCTKQGSTTVWTQTVRATFASNAPSTTVRASYNPSVLDVYAIKENDDPFQRTPSLIEAGISSTYLMDDVTFTTPAPAAAFVPYRSYSPDVASPLVRPSTPMFTIPMHVA